jgi:hypothetical protein
MSALHLKITVPSTNTPDPVPIPCLGEIDRQTRPLIGVFGLRIDNYEVVQGVQLLHTSREPITL